MDACMITGHKPNSLGYPTVWFKGRMVKLSRVSYELAFGAIPAGMVVEHKCHTEALKAGKCTGGTGCTHRACINPAHLEAITQSENIYRGAHSIDNKSSCPSGHDYSDPNNIMIRKNGRRECAECNRVRAAKNYLIKMGRA